MREIFFLVSALIFTLLGLWTYFHPTHWILLVFAGILFLVGLRDALQRHHAVRRNFPVIGHFRYFFEMIRPELQQYFVESNLDGRPVSRESRSLIYQRAKGDDQSLPFGTQHDVYAESYEWINHSIYPSHIKDEEMYVKIGGKDCLRPYTASRMNISAMSYGALGPQAISALNLGAKAGGFYHNTGEGGVSPYHERGGDLVWQIGTAYFGCRNVDGTFSPEVFHEKSKHHAIKMIEIKLSQGAKPGKGGLLPGPKVSKEIAMIRMVQPYRTVVSPSGHSAFDSAEGLLNFVALLRKLSGGKPVGFKLCVGKKSEFLDICRAMVKTQILPDFITVDGAEGGTGAAPPEFSNHMGTPLREGLHFVVETLRGFGLRDEIKIIASGRIFNGFHLISNLALGADLVNSARGMMMALGCIQALRCHTNHCPVGVATTDPRFARGLHVPTKAQRVANFQMQTIMNAKELLQATGIQSVSELKKNQIFRRVSPDSLHDFAEIYPTVPEGVLRENNYQLPEYWQRFFYSDRPSSPVTSDLPVNA